MGKDSRYIEHDCIEHIIPSTYDQKLSMCMHYFLSPIVVSKSSRYDFIFAECEAMLAWEEVCWYEGLASTVLWRYDARRTACSLA